MAAGSARWADGPASGFSLGGSTSKKDSFPRLEGLVRYACESMNVSPHQRYAPENMDAQSAVCDEIASRGVETNAACFAVNMIVHKYINGPNLDNARRALQLLDSCVKNCGDPCHLAISEKDFLNELVRRFGPTPPPRNIIQQDVLKLIETWNRTIAQKSSIKDDLGYIRDMRRLLDNKGFVFPDPDVDDVNALNGLEVKGLQTEDALKERRNSALKAKLQAYLRRGGNRNLQEANKIIKILSDYDQSDKTKIREEAAERIRDVRERTRLLTERLKTFKSGDKIASGDAFESLVDDLKSEQHKLHNTLQNDRESEDSMSILLGVNEEINRVVEWYDALKAGNFEEASRLSQGGTAKGVTLGADRTGSGNRADLSLIDLEDPQPASTAQPSQQNLEDDLLGLSMNENPGLQANQPSVQTASSVPVPPGFPQLNQGVSTSARPSAQQQQSQPQSQQIFQSANQMPPKPNYDILNNTFSNGHLSSSSTPQPSLAQQQSQRPTNPQPNQRADPITDPFASIASPAQTSLRSKSETQPLSGAQQSSQSNLLDLAEASAPTLSEAPPTLNTDDDWDFSGAPPPEEEDFIVFNEDIKIEFQVSRASETSLTITAVFSNNTAASVSKLDFRTGMPKLYPRKIDPISSSRLQPHQTHGAYLRFTVNNVSKGQAQSIPKIKWKLSRVVQDSTKTNEGEAQTLSIN